MNWLNTFRMSRLWCALLFSVALTGCGGGGTGPVTVTPSPVPSGSPTYASLRALSTSLVSDVGGLGFSTLANLPLSGQATYSGILNTRAQSGPLSGQTMIGDASVTVSFANAPQFSGSVSSLFNQSGQPIRGNLTIRNGQINRAGNPSVDRSMTANIAGRITLPDNRTADFDLIMEGDVLGAENSFAAGGVFGIAQTTAGKSQIVGQFILED